MTGDPSRHGVEIPTDGFAGEQQRFPPGSVQPTSQTQGHPFSPTQLEAVDVEHHTSTAEFRPHDHGEYGGDPDQNEAKSALDFAKARS